MSEERRICATKPIKPVAHSFGLATLRFRADRAAMTRGTLVPGRRQRPDKKNPRYFFFASATEAHESLGCSSFNVPFSGALYWTHVIPSSGACHPAWPFEAKLQGKHRAS
jgi:hypothetical protein